MARLSHLLVMAFVAVLFAVAWQTVKADPFIPVGNDPGGAGDEKTLYGRSTGFAWRAASLLYFYVSVPTPGAVNNETLYKAVFFPPVDKFSKLTIPGTFESFVFNSSSPEETTIWASGFGRNTTAKRYVQRSGGGTYAVGSYTLVITMDRGNVTDMTWIDGCSECSCTGNGGQSLTCPDYACVTNNCAIPEADCTAKGMDTCDMKIFIGWVGTDSRGRPCTSSGSLPYNFLQFGLTPAYRAAAGVDNQWLFNLNFRGT